MTLGWKNYHAGNRTIKEIRRNVDLLSSQAPSAFGGIPTVPPAGNYPVTNLFVDSTTGNLQVEYDDAGGASPIINSVPTGGNYAVTNLYVKDGELVVQYEDGT